MALITYTEWLNEWEPMGGDWEAFEKARRERNAKSTAKYKDTSELPDDSPLKTIYPGSPRSIEIAKMLKNKSS